MPLKLKVILVGERESLADFQRWSQSFQSRLFIANLKILCSCRCGVSNPVVSLGDIYRQTYHLPAPGADAWPVLIREAARTPVNKKHFRLARSGSSASVKGRLPV